MAEQMMQDRVNEKVAKQTVPAGYKQTEVGLIPEDWHIYSLHELANVGGGTTPPRAQYEKYYQFGVHPWVKTLDLNNSVISITDECVTEMALQETSLKLHDIGSVLVAMYGGFNQIGRTGLLNVNAAINQALVAILPKKGSLDSEYLLHNLNYNVDYWKGIASSSRKDPNITSNDIKAFKLPIPTIEEQKAIATVVADSDTLIVGLEQLIAKKQAIKTATMQQLLTGRTRLPQFALRPDGTPKGYKSSELGEIPEDWEVKTLRNMLAESPKYGINAPAVELSRDTPAYIRITDISNDGYYRPTENVGVRSVFSEQYILHVNDIVLARTGASVGKSYFYKVEDGKLVYAGFLIKISPLQQILNSSYLFQFMKTKQYWDWVVVNSMRSGQPGINGAEFASMLIPTPSINEQTAIATILTDMDSELTTLVQKLAKARDLKQGMMQQLLTGRIRLPLPQEAG